MILCGRPAFYSAFPGASPLAANQPWQETKLGASKPNIAVIDDDGSVRDAIANLLEALGYSICAFPSGRAFLDSGAAATTTCLIADIHMPEMTGLELLEQMVAGESCIPVIFITAFPRPAIRDKALKLGARAYLSKPVHQDRLLECLEQAIA
jgi:FixJ family two-component response regulator